MNEILYLTRVTQLVIRLISLEALTITIISYSIYKQNSKFVEHEKGNENNTLYYNAYL